MEINDDFRLSVTCDSDSLCDERQERGVGGCQHTTLFEQTYTSYIIYTWYKTWAMFDVISPRRACTTFITVHNQPYTLALENDETLLSWARD